MTQSHVFTRVDLNGSFYGLSTTFLFGVNKSIYVSPDKSHDEPLIQSDCVLVRRVKGHKGQCSQEHALRCSCPSLHPLSSCLFPLSAQSKGLVRMQEKAAVWKPGGEASLETDTGDTLIQTSSLWRCDK